MSMPRLPLYPISTSHPFYISFPQCHDSRLHNLPLTWLLTRLCSVLQNSWRISKYRSLMIFLLPLAQRIMSSMLFSVRDSFRGRVIVLMSSIGFSFSGQVREPFPAVIQALQETKLPVTSVDAPSSWNIEDGPPATGLGSSFMPTALVSLTAPKPLVKHFKGRHFIGGRYVPSTACLFRDSNQQP